MRRKSGIYVEGIDEFQKFVKDFERGLKPQGFNEWANRVSQTATEMCNDPDCKRIRFRPDGTKQTIEVDWY